jgi:hypothetical protein
VLEEDDVEIAIMDSNITGMSMLCDEFGFTSLAEQLSVHVFHSTASSTDSRMIDRDSSNLVVQTAIDRISFAMESHHIQFSVEVSLAMESFRTHFAAELFATIESIQTELLVSLSGISMD